MTAMTTQLHETEGLMMAVAFLWIAAAAAFVMRHYRYQTQADCAMLIVLVCFSVLVVRHHLSLPITMTAAAAEPAPEYVTREGDGFFHHRDCERLLGRMAQAYAGEGKSPCVDCVLPRRHQAIQEASYAVAADRRDSSAAGHSARPR